MRSQRSGAVVVDLGEFRKKREERDKPAPASAAPRIVWVQAPIAPAPIAPVWGYWMMPYWSPR